MRFSPSALIGVALQAQPSFEQRKLAMIDAYAHYQGKGDYGYAEIAAKLWRHEDAAWCSQKLEQFLAAPSGDMFWMFPVTAIAYLDQGQLTPSARQALRNAWKTYMPYRGDTENHFLLYYTSLYLMSQMWEQPGDAWYTGKSSAENMEEARQWIEVVGEADHDARPGRVRFAALHGRLSAADVVSGGVGEGSGDEEAGFDDARLSDRGLCAGKSRRALCGRACARLRTQLVEPANGVSADFGWLWFGVGHPEKVPANYVLYYLLASAYEPPEVLKQIATDRSQPYTHLERKRTRNRWRFNDELHGPVYKTTYVRREYAVGSDQGGVLQPIQQHSWDVTWSVPDARGVQNTFFTMHPYSSIAGIANLLRLQSGWRGGGRGEIEEDLRFAGQAAGRVALREASCRTRTR